MAKFKIGEIVSYNDNSLAAKKDYIYLGSFICQPLIFSPENQTILATTDDRLVSRGRFVEVSKTINGENVIVNCNFEYKKTV